MWMQRILVILLLQRVLGHTLSRYEPQESDVYELRTDKETNTVQFVYPKSSVPKLREIIYYHIIEKPYENPSEASATPNEVVPESDTERFPTNTHGYQFLDNLRVDYDTPTQSSNPSAEEDYAYDEEGYGYIAPPAVSIPAETNAEATEPEQVDDYPEETNESFEEAAENPEENLEAADNAEPEETVDPELQEETNSEDTDDDKVTDETESDPDLTENHSDLSETDAVADLTESFDDITSGTEFNTADVAIVTTKTMTEEIPEVNEEDALVADEIVKQLEARNQLFGSPDQMKERLMKVRSYLPHLHPMNSQFEPQVVSSKRRRRRRSVNAKRNTRRRREILNIFPQGDTQPRGRALLQPFDESDIPEAPTLSPLNSAELPDYIRSELKPEDVDSDSETPVTEESGFMPPPNTYGVKLDNGNGYVWNTLYGSASSEPSYKEDQEYTTVYHAPITDETQDIPELEELPAEEPMDEEIPKETLPETPELEELPAEELIDGEIPEENLAELEPMTTEETPFEITEDVDVGIREDLGADEKTEYEDQGPKDSIYVVYPEESFIDAEDPAYEQTELPGDEVNAEETLPEVIEEVTELPYSYYETTQYEMKTSLFDDIFDSIRDIEKMTDPMQYDNDAIIENKIHEYLELEKDLLHEPIVVDYKEIEEEVDQQEAAEEEPAVEDDLIEEEQQDGLFGDNNNEGLAPETNDSEGDVPGHGTYGFHLVGGVGDVWNDFTGVRYHIENDEPFDNFGNFEPSINNDINKPDYKTGTILKSSDDITDKDPELDNSDKTTDDNINLRIANDVSEEMSSKNDIEMFDNIFKDIKTALTERSDNQVTTALPDLSESIESSPFLALLDDDKYRDWVREWTIEYTRFLAEYINDTVQAAIAERELEHLKEEAPIEGKSLLYLNDKELTASPEIEAIINTVSDKYLRRRRKHCRNCEKPQLTEEANEIINDANDGNDKIVNVFIFFTGDQAEKILDLIKPDNDKDKDNNNEDNDKENDYEYVDPSDFEYKPDESELADAEEEEGVKDYGVVIDPGFMQDPFIVPTESPIDEDAFEHTEDATEPSADDFESDTLPEDNPEVVEPVYVEDTADETIPEESDGSEILVDETVTESEIIEEDTGSEIEESESGTDEISEEPEETTDETANEEVEIPNEVLEVVTEDLDLENEETPDPDLTGVEPVLEGAVEDTEPLEDEEEKAEPVEEEEAEVKPVEEEDAEAETAEEKDAQAEPAEEEDAEAEPVEEEVAEEENAEEEIAEPVEEENAEEEIAEPVEEENAEEEIAEPVEKEVAEEENAEEEIAEPVEEENAEEDIAEPVEEENAEEDIAEPVEENAEEEIVEPVEEENAEEEIAEPVEEEVAEEELAEPVEEENAEEEIVEPVEEENAEEVIAEPVEEENAEEEIAEPVEEENAEEEIVKPVEEENAEEEIAEPVEEEVAEEENAEEELAEPVEEENAEEEIAEPVAEETEIAEPKAEAEAEPIEEVNEETRKKREDYDDDDDDDDDDDEDSDKK